MIRITTTQAHAADLKQRRVSVASQCLDAIEALMPGDCKHKDGRVVASCVRCAERRTVQAALAAVRETGGIKP